MELRQLRYFVAAADELHFGRAARALTITPPALSQQIKALEQSLGVPLFVRANSRVRLTPAGAELLPLARQTIASAGELLDTAQRIGRGRARQLRLGFLTYSLTDVTRRLLTDFDRAVPDVTVELRQFEWDDPSAGLLPGTSDAALVRLPFSGEERLTTVELAREQLLVILPNGHELASAPSVTCARLASEVWLEAALVTDPVFARFWFMRDARDTSSTSVVSRSGTMEEWLSEVTFGRGVDLAPEGIAEDLRRRGLVLVPISDAPPSRLVLAWRTGDAPEAVTALARLADATYICA